MNKRGLSVSREERVVVALASDEFAVNTLQVFVNEGFGGIRRTRQFPNKLTLETPVMHGEIQYGRDFHFSVPVVAKIVGSTNEIPDGAFVFFSSRSGRARQFTSVKKNMMGATIPQFSRTRAVNVNLFALFPDNSKIIGAGDHIANARANLRKNAANHLAAMLTSAHVFRPDFLEFPGGDEAEHFTTVGQWVIDERPVMLLSACCLNADEPRTGIVNSLTPAIIEPLVRTALAAFRNFPHISEWVLTTFGPDDYAWLGELNIQKVLLPYMWDAPLEKVRADMLKNFQLVQKLAAILGRYLPFPVRAIQLASDTHGIDVAWLVAESRRRAEQMMPALLADPPKIFAQLPNMEAKIARIQQEALLYLLDTLRFGQRPGEQRPAVLNCGVEVHGQYWMTGDLFRGPQGEFLPLAWFPQCVRQHWGDWMLKNKQLTSERDKLVALLNQTGIGGEVVVDASELTVDSELMPLALR